MQLLTVARRADFGYSLRSRFDNARNRLSSGVSYSKAVRAAATLDKSQIEFHEFTYLAGLVSLAEALVADIGSDFLVRYPGHLNDKNVSLDGLAEGVSIGATVDSLASKTINDWSYGPFPVLVKQVV